MSGPTEQDLARFIRHEARLIDEKRLDQWLALFTDDGLYWVPATPGQPDGLQHNSLAYEDRLLLQLRIERIQQRALRCRVNRCRTYQGCFMIRGR